MPCTRTQARVQGVRKDLTHEVRTEKLQVLRQRTMRFATRAILDVAPAAAAQ